LAVADLWLYVVLLTLWQWVRAKLVEPDWVPAVWELRDNPNGPVPLGRPADPETGALLRDTWEPTALPNPFAIIREGRILARYIKAGPRPTFLTIVLWHVPEIIALVIVPVSLLVLALISG